MGRMIESVALSRGHEIVCVIDPLTSPQTFDSPAFRSADVAIEFTRPEAAEQNVRAALAQGVPVVSGTTGWDVEGLKATLNAPYGEADRSTVGRKELSTLNDSQPSTLNSQLIYLGDSLVDRDTARNAGLPFVACSWGFVPRETLVAEGVEHIIDQPVDLLNYVH